MKTVKETIENFGFKILDNDLIYYDSLLNRKCRPLQIEQYTADDSKVYFEIVVLLKGCLEIIIICNKTFYSIENFSGKFDISNINI
jgi:hypothetical protein